MTHPDPMARLGGLPTMEEAPLFCAPRPIVPTKRRARRSMAAASIGAHRGRARGGDAGRIQELLRQRGPMTIDAVAELMNKYPHQISPRFGELEARGKLFRLEQTAPTRSGSAATLWNTSAAAIAPGQEDPHAR